MPRELLKPGANIRSGRSPVRMGMICSRELAGAYPFVSQGQGHHFSLPHVLAYDSSKYAPVQVMHEEGLDIHG
jgi:hypothetical protein